MSEKASRILVALDGTPAAETILAAIMPLVRSSPAELLLLRVVERAEEGKDARAYLGRAIEALAAQQVRAVLAVESGQPGPAILARLQSGAFDLGAMTTRGRSGVGRLFLGSVAEFIVRSARVPLILNRPEAKIGDWKNIVVPLDGSRAAETILEDLFRLAPGIGSSLHLIHVGEVVLAAAGAEYPYSAVTMPDMKPYLDEVAGRLRAKGLTVTTEALIGAPGPEIVRRAAESGAGLIALTTHGRTGLSRLIMGSVAERIVRTAPCPILVRRSVG